MIIILFIAVTIAVIGYAYRPKYVKKEIDKGIEAWKYDQRIEKYNSMKKQIFMKNQKEHEAINAFIKNRFQAISHSKIFMEANIRYVKIVEHDDWNNPITYKVEFSAISMNEAAQNFAARKRLIQWGWEDYERRIIHGFDEENNLHTYEVDNWTDYITVLRFINVDTGEEITNTPKITPERDLAGYFANLVKINMPYFHLLSEKIATEGSVNIYAEVLNDGKKFTKRELKALVNEIEGLGYSVVCDYVTGKLEMDFADDIFDEFDDQIVELEEEDLPEIEDDYSGDISFDDLTPEELAYIESIQ